MPEQVDSGKQVFQEGQEQKSSIFVEERCICEATEEDMLRKLLFGRNVEQATSS